MLGAYIKNQKLTPVTHHIVADSINYLQCTFHFTTTDWDGLDKWAHFEKDGTVYDMHLTDDRIHPEDGLNLTEGKWKLYLHGSAYSGGEVIRRITTNPVELTVHPTGALNGQPFDELPPSIVEQILARLEEIENTGYILTDADKQEIADMVRFEDAVSAEDLEKTAAAIPNSAIVNPAGELVMQHTNGTDVSELFKVALPAGGSGAAPAADVYELINTITIDNAETTQVVFSADSSGQPFSLKKAYLRIIGLTDGYTYTVVRVNNRSWTEQFSAGKTSGAATTDKTPYRIFLDVSGAYYQCLSMKGATLCEIERRLPGERTFNNGIQSVIESITSLIFMRGSAAALDNGLIVNLYGVRA